MSIAKVLAAILIIVAVAAVAIYLMGRFEQTKPTYDLIMEKLTGLKNYVTASPNWAVLAGGAGSLVTVAGLAASKLSAAKQQISQVTSQAQTQVSNFNAEKDKLTQQFTGQINDVQAKAQAQIKSATEEAAQAKTQLSTVQNNYSVLQQKQVAFEQQYNEIKAQNAKLIAQLEVLRPQVK